VLAAAVDRALPALRAAAPPGVEVRPFDGSLEGVVFAVPDHGMDFRSLRSAPDLAVVQVMSAGTDWIEPYVPARAVLCNARGARDAPVAEWVVGALLGWTSRLLRSARDRVWEHDEVLELASMTVVVLGHGSIGAAVAERLAPFGTRVIGVARSTRDGVRAVSELPSLLPAADALVVLAPLTGETRGMVDAAMLAQLRDGALVVNAGRGPVIETDALLAETASGRLSAVLDVVDPEPLPEDHPLWSAPGVLAITPHLAGDSAAADDRAAAFAARQLVRFAAGEPLYTVVGGLNESCVVLGAICAQNSTLDATTGSPARPRRATACSPSPSCSRAVWTAPRSRGGSAAAGCTAFTAASTRSATRTRAARGTCSRR
jgi:phosphoglycerate dehydrogenase-like enzyme